MEIDNNDYTHTQKRIVENAPTSHKGTQKETSFGILI